MSAIGVFDSGVGGLTVAREIMRQLPNETIYYLGDVENCPYGDKTKDEIIKYTERAVDFLVNQGIKMLVIACNTATAAALEHLESKFDIPIIGVVKPGARRAIQASINEKVLVLGTSFTANSQIYSKEIDNIKPTMTVYNKACPTFTPFIEDEGYLNEEKTEKLLLNELENTKKLDMDTVILGCTHYPILKKEIEHFFGDSIKVISSGREVAREVSMILTYEKLHEKKQNEVKHKFFISANSDNFEKIASNWLKKEITVDIVNLSK